MSDALRQAIFRSEWSEGAQRAYVELLNNSVLRAKLGELLREILEKQEAFVKTDLVTEAGRLEAVRFQGEIAGMQRAFDQLTETEND